MFLKNLSIHNNESLIRSISFHKGINLIVDETESGNKTDSGNSVGKTSVLRLIDYCLDGKEENIIKDPEFRDSNIKVEQFLKQNNIIITLTLIENIGDANSDKIIIQRNFLSRKEKIQKINGESYPDKDFSKKLIEESYGTNKGIAINEVAIIEHHVDVKYVDGFEFKI